METANEVEEETFRVIIFNRAGAEILVGSSSARLMLPCIRIPHWQRVAENLALVVDAEFGEQVVCLFTPDPRSSAPHRKEIHYQVAEHWRTVRERRLPLTWASVSALSEDSFVDPYDYSVILHSLAQCNAGDPRVPTGPFARLGWFHEFREWVAKAIEPRGLHISENFRQFNAGLSFSLVRFETNGPAVWFKAVGEPNQKEFPLTCTLAQLFPSYLPSILETRRDWNGWLAQEVEGTNLNETGDLELWAVAAEAMAKLQIGSINHCQDILVSGARDQRTAVLSDRVRPFMDVMAQLMDQQAKVSPPILGQKELLLLGDRLQTALEGLRVLEVPDALGHLDLNPANIIVSTKQCTFLDWAEAYVGNPFFSLQYLLEHFRRATSAEALTEARLTAAYFVPWEQVIPRTAITEAMASVPLLAAFAYATGNEAWKDPERLRDLNTAGYLRSLTRRMNREANAVSSRWSPCLG